TRSQLRDLAGSLRLTEHAREALGRLRQEGLAIAIVSGGGNTFLEDALPDFRECVDFAFINELTFDSKEGIEGVIATADDFEGKVDALDRVCGAVGCDPSEAVFVGDQINDDAVMLKSGLGIAYTDRDVSAGGAHNVVVAKDDLREILPLVLQQ